MRVINTSTARTDAVCVKWVNEAGTREVSVAADTSLGAFQDMIRCDLRCYAKDENGKERDATNEVFPNVQGTVYASNADLRTALAWLGD